MREWEGGRRDKLHTNSKTKHSRAEARERVAIDRKRGERIRGRK